MPADGPVPLREVLRAAAQALRERAGSPTAAALEAEVLLAAALGRSRAALLTLDVVARDAFVRFDGWVRERSATGRPVAYLLGVREFRSLRLQVDERVLVPRPETEELVEALLDLGEQGELPPGPVVDRGTGSGAVALALAAAGLGHQVVGSELSPAALEVARANRDALAPSVALVAADGLGAFRRASLAAVVANPPYVAAGDWERLPLDVRAHEPRCALVPGEGSVEAVYARLAREAAVVLRPGGWLLAEVGAGQAPGVCATLRAAGFQGVTARRDLAGIERVVQGRLGRGPPAVVSEPLPAGPGAR